MADSENGTADGSQASAITKSGMGRLKLLPIRQVSPWDVNSTCSQFAFQVRKRCLFDIEAVSNDPFDPRIHALLSVEAREKCSSRCKRRR